jgi:hypothetical protein
MEEVRTIVFSVVLLAPPLSPRSYRSLHRQVVPATQRRKTERIMEYAELVGGGGGDAI